MTETTKLPADIASTLNWKLLRGSHPFPGPEGGTCINEAAIIAAGFEYKRVGSANDCPPCFSRPIAAFAISLNDRMPDGLRNELLMPFVTRLSGTADKRDVEVARVRLIGTRICSDIIAPMCDRLGLDTEATHLRDPAYLTSSRARTRALLVSIFKHDKMMAAIKKAVAYAVAYADADADADADAVAYAVAYAADAVAVAYADAVAVAYAERRKVWEAAVKILDDAIKLGNQPTAIEQGIIITRMEAAKAAAAVRESA